MMGVNITTCICQTLTLQNIEAETEIDIVKSVHWMILKGSNTCTNSYDRLCSDSIPACYPMIQARTPYPEDTVIISCL